MAPREIALARVVAIGVLVIVAGCSLVTSLEGLSDDYGRDASSKDSGAATGDAQPDAIARADAGDAGDAGEAAPGPDAAGLVVLARNQSEPMGIALSETEVFWANAQENAVYRLAKTAAVGTLPTRVALQGVNDPFDVAVDATYLYWTERNGNSAYRQAHSAGTREPFCTGAARTAFLAIENGIAYITDYRTDQPTVGSVVRGDGGSSSCEVLYANQGVTSGIAVLRGKIFWGKGGADAGPTMSITEGQAAGGDNPLITTTSKVNGVAVDDEYAYWIEDGKRIVRASRGDRSQRTLYEGNSFQDGDIAVDGTAVYWTERGSGHVRRMPKPTD